MAKKLMQDQKLCVVVYLTVKSCIRRVPQTLKQHEASVRELLNIGVAV